MIILDFETNSSNIYDVIEVAAFRVQKVDDEYLCALLDGKKFFLRDGVEALRNKEEEINKEAKGKGAILLSEITRQLRDEIRGITPIVLGNKGKDKTKQIWELVF